MPLSSNRRRHLYCLPRLPHCPGPAPLWRRGWGLELSTAGSSLCDWLVGRRKARRAIQWIQQERERETMTTVSHLCIPPLTSALISAQNKYL
uniref:Uncharacterized protein n=1 Tax=Myripristis murdjan TaxID=586833 RepID=A0A667Z204_9TELE